MSEFIKDTNYPIIAEYEDLVDNIITNKSLKVYDTNILLKGEANAQYIPFIIDRYYTGVDLTDKLIQIHYVNSLQQGDYSIPINVEYSDSKIRFGWLVPNKACLVEGDLEIGIEISGTNSADEVYLWKSNVYYMTVNKSIELGQGIVEPDKSWYEAFTLEVAKLRSVIQQVTASDVDYGAEIRAARVDDMNVTHPTMSDRFESDLQRMYAKKNYEVVDQNKGELIRFWLGSKEEQSSAVVGDNTLELVFDETESFINLGELSENPSSTTNEVLNAISENGVYTFSYNNTTYIMIVSNNGEHQTIIYEDGYDLIMFIRFNDGVWYVKPNATLVTRDYVSLYRHHLDLRYWENNGAKEIRVNLTIINTNPNAITLTTLLKYFEEYPNSQRSATGYYNGKDAMGNDMHGIVDWIRYKDISDHYYVGYTKLEDGKLKHYNTAITDFTEITDSVEPIYNGV